MSRQAREKSQTGIYHVMARGINRQDIFCDEEDNKRYLETLMRVKLKTGINVYGYCLMRNHVHLLIKEGTEGLSVSMKSLGTGFARWYNWKYDRCGHVFQDRYKSEPVENEAYLLTVIRYIHLNPVKAGIVDMPENWKWSSCGDYYGRQNCLSGLIETDLILGIFSNDKKDAVKTFINFMDEVSSDKCLELDENKRKTDEEVLDEILQLTNGRVPLSIHGIPKKDRNDILLAAKAIEGTTYRQLARIFGVSTSVICKA